MTTITNANRNDRVYSDLHVQWVRISKVEWDGMVEVYDPDTLKVLPDLVHPTQIHK